MRLWVSTCMERAGMLTYILPQIPHFFAVLVERLRCVCLCLNQEHSYEKTFANQYAHCSMFLDRLLLVA